MIRGDPWKLGEDRSRRGNWTFSSLISSSSLSTIVDKSNGFRTRIRLLCSSVLLRLVVGFLLSRLVRSFPSTTPSIRRSGDHGERFSELAPTSGHSPHLPCYTPWNALPVFISFSSSCPQKRQPQVASLSRAIDSLASLRRWRPPVGDG